MMMQAIPIDYSGALEVAKRACLAGGLGQRPLCELMSLLLAHAGRLVKFGA